jgi:hypothetical protein
VVAVLVALIVASALPTSANAGAIEVNCTSDSFVFGTPVPAGDHNVRLVGDGWCTVALDETVNGNIQIAGAAQLSVFGTVNGNVNANTEIDLELPLESDPANYAVVLIASSGTINGNVTQMGSGYISIGGAVNGNVNMEVGSTGILGVGGSRGDVTVDGNVSHAGTGCLVVWSLAGMTTTVEGNVARHGDGGLVSQEPWGIVGNLVLGDCDIAPFPPADPLGGQITIIGNACGLLVDPFDKGGVTVTGNVSANC